MSDTVLYLLICAAGVVCGLPLRRVKGKLGFLDPLQTVCVFCLVFTMGTRIGMSDEVVESLPVYGVYAVVITLSVLAASVLAVHILRCVMGLNRYGHMAGEGRSRLVGKSREKQAGTPAMDPMTVCILGFVALGILCGYTVLRHVFPNFGYFNQLASLAITVELSTLLFFVGIGLGLKEGLAGQFRAVGLRVLAIPLGVLAGTMAASFLLGLFLPIGLKSTLAVGAGLSWYSLAPGLLMDAGDMTAGAISFLHNVMRELFSIVLIPVVARHVGYVEAVGMPAAAAMDSSLPIVVRATSPEMAVYSFLSGLVLTLIVPFLVPVFF